MHNEKCRPRRILCTLHRAFCIQAEFFSSLSVLDSPLAAHELDGAGNDPPEHHLARARPWSRRRCRASGFGRRGADGLALLLALAPVAPGREPDLLLLPGYLLARILAVGRCVLDLGVHLGADEDREAA